MTTQLEHDKWDLSQWLYYLENRYAQEICLGLERVQQVAALLNLLHPSPLIITVAGTNGKGTTVSALTAIYQAAGYQVGTYTSPHLLVFNERIQINRQMITDEALCQAFRGIEKKRKDIKLTYFEMTTLAALWHFSQYPLDVIILEVGMGGRLDATNIIDADLAIITTIDLDHQSFLGHSKEQIGIEKAGILRAGRPFIFADKNMPHSIAEHAHLLNCVACLFEKDFFIKQQNSEVFYEDRYQKITLPLLSWQLQSIAAAIHATSILHTKLPICGNIYASALQGMVLQGRQQELDVVPKVLLDVAHNAQSADYLAEIIKKKKSQFNKIHAVFSALGDKDIASLLAPLLNLVDSWHIGLLNSKRAAAKTHLLKQMEDHGILNSKCHDTVIQAYQAATKIAGANDLIIVYGSFYTVSEVLQHISEDESI